MLRQGLVMLATGGFIPCMPLLLSLRGSGIVRRLVVGQRVSGHEFPLMSAACTFHVAACFRYGFIDLVPG
jgi:hypothetical protein